MPLLLVKDLPDKYDIYVTLSEKTAVKKTFTGKYIIRAAFTPENSFADIMLKADANGDKNAVFDMSGGGKETVLTALSAVKEYSKRSDTRFYIKLGDDISLPYPDGLSAYINKPEKETPLYAAFADNALFDEKIPDFEVKEKRAGTLYAPTRRRIFGLQDIPAPEKPKARLTLEQYIKSADKSFSMTLLELIDERNMTDAECYKAANVDRKLFSKIRSNPLYRPSKNTAVAFCIALKLTLEEAQALLSKAGYALSHTTKSDLIIEYFIINGKYDVYEINEALYEHDQALLGAAD